MFRMRLSTLQSQIRLRDGIGKKEISRLRRWKHQHSKYFHHPATAEDMHPTRTPSNDPLAKMTTLSAGTQIIVVEMVVVSNVSQIGLR